MGGAIFCGYNFVIDYMRHHEEANPRPAYMDHMLATTVVSSSVAAFYITRPIHLFNTMVFSMILIAPVTWYFYKFATIGTPHRHPNIFYQNDCTEEEIERFKQQDALEEAAANMKLLPGYGYTTRGDPAAF